MPFDAPDPRPHHYRFAHRLLPKIAFQAGDTMLEACRDGVLGEMLVEQWNEYAGVFPEEQRLPADGLTVAMHEVGGSEAALVTLPEPAGMAEAYFVAIVVTEGSVRFHTLEYSRSFPDNQPMTVLGEWTREGNHINLGAGPPPDAAAFLAAIDR